MLYEHLDTLKRTKAALIADPQAVGNDSANFAIGHLNDAINLLDAAAANFPAPPPAQDAALVAENDELRARLARLEAAVGGGDTGTPTPAAPVAPATPAPAPAADPGLDHDRSAQEMMDAQKRDIWSGEGIDPNAELELGDPAAVAAEQALANGRRHFEDERESDVDRPIEELNR